MSRTAQRTRSSIGRRSVVVGLVVAAVMIIAALGGSSLWWRGVAFTEVLGGGLRGGATPGAGAEITRADGTLPDRTTVFDTQYPGVANLDSDLLRALRRAAAASSEASSRSSDPGRDADLYVNSGWRSARYQTQLLAEAITQYGSKDEAARWVATPQTSPHVSGEAVDLGPVAATAWLSEHGARYGLCQIYRNEPWHFELRPEATDDGCPAMYDDPTRDPRMHR